MIHHTLEPFERRSLVSTVATTCGRKSSPGGATHVTSKVDCKRCVATVAYRAAAVERRLSSHVCSLCGGKGTLISATDRRCPVCSGVGIVVPCVVCKGTTETRGGKCDQCQRSGAEPV